MEELVRAYVAALDAVDRERNASEHALACIREAQAEADALRDKLIELDTPKPRKLVSGERLVVVSQDDVIVEKVSRCDTRKR